MQNDPIALVLKELNMLASTRYIIVLESAIVADRLPPARFCLLAAAWLFSRY
jgi:hypothetical protein